MNVAAMERSTVKSYIIVLKIFIFEVVIIQAHIVKRVQELVTVFILKLFNGSRHLPGCLQAVQNPWGLSVIITAGVTGFGVTKRM